jgi:hypothetical protein
MFFYYYIFCYLNFVRISISYMRWFHNLCSRICAHLAGNIGGQPRAPAVLLPTKQSPYPDEDAYSQEISRLRSESNHGSPDFQPVAYYYNTDYAIPSPVYD